MAVRGCRYGPTEVPLRRSSGPVERIGMSLRPKYISFDCYGTLLYFEMAPAARRLYADRISEPAMDDFTADFSAYRLDEVLGAWRPYRDVVEGALRRLCAKWRIDYRDSDAESIYAA